MARKHGFNMNLAEIDPEEFRKNPTKFLKLPKEKYSKQYLKALPGRIKKAHKRKIEKEAQRLEKWNEEQAAMKKLLEDAKNSASSNGNGKHSDVNQEEFQPDEILSGRIREAAGASQSDNNFIEEESDFEREIAAKKAEEEQEKENKQEEKRAENETAYEERPKVDLIAEMVNGMLIPPAAKIFKKEAKDCMLSDSQKEMLLSIQPPGMFDKPSWVAYTLTAVACIVQNVVTASKIKPDVESAVQIKEFDGKVMVMVYNGYELQMNVVQTTQAA